MKKLYFLSLIFILFTKSASSSNILITPIVKSTSIIDHHGSNEIVFQIKSWIRKMSSKAVEGNIIAILAHLSLAGLLIAFILHKSDPSSIGSFYIRQMLGIYILLFIGTIIFNLLPFFISLSVPIAIVLSILSLIFSLTLVVFWTLSFVYAFKKIEKPVPIVGKLFQKIFKRIR